MKKNQKTLFMLIMLLSLGYLNMKAENDSTNTSESTNNEPEQSSTEEPPEEEIDPTIEPFSIEWILEMVGID